VLGGHAILWSGYQSGLCRLYNSWEPSWGDGKGHGWLPIEDLAKLLRQDGECCTAVERKVTAR